MQNTKICSKCKKEKSTDEFREKKVKDKIVINSQCKQCEKEYDKIRRERLKQKEIDYSIFPKTKECTKCKIEKSLDEFDNKKIGKYGKDSICKACKHQYRKEYYAEHKESEIKRNIEFLNIGDNREKMNEQRRKFYSENLEVKRERAKNYYHKNPEKMREEKRQYYYNNKEIHYIKSREIALKNPLRTKFYKDKSRAKSKGALVDITFTEYKEIYKYFNNECAYCGSGENITTDHVIPLMNGGSHTKNNIILSCISCNCSKEKNDFLEWYRSKEFYSKEREEKILKFIEMR